MQLKCTALKYRMHILNAHTANIDLIFQIYLMTGFTPNFLYYHILKYTEFIVQ